MNNVTLLHGDCLTLLPTLPAASVDLVLADLPYQVTACQWDSLIPLDKLWVEYKRVLKPGGAVVLTATQPFTTDLINSNRAWFRYSWVWDKVNLFTNHMNARKMPMRQHEDVLVFCDRQPIYNPQMRPGKPYTGRGTGNIEIPGVARRDAGNTSGQAYPATVLPIPAIAPGNRGLHPTQKPVALFSYLLRTYSHPGDLVLDNCAGSGTTGVAAIETGRRAILMEQDPAYCAIIERRIAAAQPALLQEAS